jgi:GntR family transcriptional regulator
MSSRVARHAKGSRKMRSGGFARRRVGRGVARYYQLYELLSGALNEGSIPAGSALPSEPELVARYRLSRTTVRRALARLEDEGRIVRRRGSGTFARQNREPARLDLNLDSYYKDVPAIASQTSVSVLRFEQAAVPATLRELQPQVGARALVIQRLRRFQGTPYQLSTSYIPESIGRRIRKTSLSRASLLTLLDEIGPRTVTTEHTTSAVAADAIAARRLDVSLGTPLLRIRAVLCDGRGRLRAIHESLCRPDRFHVRAALERNPARNSNSQWRLRQR